MAFQALNAPPSQANASIAVPHRSVTLSAVDEAFAARPELQAAIRGLLGTNEQSDHYELFEGIARYVLQLQKAASTATAERDELDDRLTKRRKLDGDAPAATSQSNGSALAAAASAPIPTETATAGSMGAKGKTDQFAHYAGQRFDGLSFSAPQRKKLTLEVGQAKGQGIRAIGADGGTEFGIPYSDLECVFQLPVPEKTTAQHNFCAFPRDAAPTTATDGASSHEPMVWTTAATRPKGADESAPTPSEAMAQALQKAKCPLEVPSADEFASAIPQPHRKGETAYHVKAFRGSKDGFLFFLARGIVWGFKKPLVFFPFSAIASVSYTAILQRTFNLVIATNVASDGVAGGEEVEFSMVDQADFAGIEGYVKKHDLHDASMAEARKAKRVNVNGPPRRGAEGEGEEEGKEGELEKAQREADEEAAKKNEDSDDEEDDENFDPGSEGESEGSGSGESSDDEDGDEGGKVARKKKGADDDGDDDDDDDDDEDDEEL